MKYSTEFWSAVITQGIKNIWLFTKAEMKVIFIIILLLAIAFHSIGIAAYLAVLLAIGISLADIIPVIGSGIIFIPWIISEWLIGDVNQGLILLVLYFGMAIIKIILEPLFLGKDLELPFWLPVAVVIVCTLVFNVFGILVSSILIPFISAYRQVSKRIINS